MSIYGVNYLKILDKTCFICGSKIFATSLQGDYIKCVACGHETIKNYKHQSFIINEILSVEGINKQGLLDKFKQKVLKKCTVTNDFLLDVGSASGKFLYHNKSFFKRCAGIEVTEECISFAKNHLGLEIVKDISEVTNNISVATFWHSLEHMSDENIQKILDVINSKSSDDTRVIISVPNNESLQYALFGDRYAYYDLQSHIHQFSVKSLDKLMEKYGFEKQCNFYSFPYSSFGYLQGFVNLVNPIHNYLYYRKKRGQTFTKSKGKILFLDIYNFLFLLLFILPSLLFSIHDLIHLDKGSVITACYKKKITNKQVY
ncbi:MAG: class I SAM-dependent methyltransferase [Candidatus Methanoperedens sp.]|nr:class I SAM-dependent methyltransferase [Candidatus Methanoperedens sp.]